MLESVINKYNGVYVLPEQLPIADTEFNQQLSESIKPWRDSGKQLVWLQLEANRSHLIPTALKHGFLFHHSSGTTAMLTLKLVETAVLPCFATHTIGVGGVVLSEQQEILTIVERRDQIDKPSHYKFPGGMADPGEHFAQAAVREVFEETGIRTQFEGLLSFRHHHHGQFGTSNIYAACLLTPLSFDINIDPDEIGHALWMPIDDYLAGEGVSLFNKHVLQQALGQPYFAAFNLEGYRQDENSYEVFSPC